ncbi:hypothetical protein [Streptomyces piniterrae]|uniref:hypothetical protein n=1 Tax=Streptomyces piniterrae TaxID=2571125 RepID=UPI001652B6FC|nr:hypothetical protein [Streptomyces piniterrae]
MNDHMPLGPTPVPYVPLGGTPANPRSPHGTPGNRDDEPDPSAWLAPLISTAVTAFLGFFAVIVGMMSPMVCDSCSRAEADRFGVLFLGYFAGMLVPAALLIVSWILPWRRKHAANRIAFAAFAPCSVVALVLLYFTLLGDVTG